MTGALRKPMGTSIPGHGSLQARLICAKIGKKEQNYGLEDGGSGVRRGEYRYENLALNLDFSCSRELKRNSKAGYWQKICVE